MELHTPGWNYSIFTGVLNHEKACQKFHETSSTSRGVCCKAAERSSIAFQLLSLRGGKESMGNKQVGFSHMESDQIGIKKMIRRQPGINSWLTSPVWKQNTENSSGRFLWTWRNVFPRNTIIKLREHIAVSFNLCQWDTITWQYHSVHVQTF